MSANRTNKHELAQVVTLTENIVAHALRGEWDAVNELQLVQGRQVRALIAEPGGVLNENMELLNKLQALMNQVIDLAETEKAAVAEQLCRFRKVESVNKAYLQNME
ncbi:hypothetical protein [Methylotuvimicrobium buryatense]|uniref:Flagellar protein FliT n=1 Tax=Methylotuvimicrobium buryatense TaxID=95641 RepID=A0A4P9UTF6_METBY|nr:hypothetical protein [Methylotuvimicrobium buryatense]QCW83863.1 hypothetical protein EQU24_17660 [Methylotuvimicrobium buryatense]